MALTDDLLRRIKAKRQEQAALEQQMTSLEQQILAVKTYVMAMEDALKLAERKPTSDNRDPANALRKGSMPGKAYPVIKRVGKAVYLVPLLEGMGVPVTAANKRALASSLSAYARRKEIFTRPEPNTFGLIEFENAGEAEVSGDEAPLPGMGQLKLAR